jgi:hypothetical protein
MLFILMAYNPTIATHDGKKQDEVDRRHDGKKENKVDRKRSHEPCKYTAGLRRLPTVIGPAGDLELVRPCIRLAYTLRLMPGVLFFPSPYRQVTQVICIYCSTIDGQRSSVARLGPQLGSKGLCMLVGMERMESGMIGMK